MTDQKKGVNWRAWTVGTLVVLAIIVAIQNSAKTHFDFLFLSTTAPLIVILLLFLGVGAVVGYVGPLIRRHRREERRAHEA